MVGDIKHDALAGESLPALYCAYTQILEDRRWLMTDMMFRACTSAAPEALAPPVRAALAGIDNRLPSLFGCGHVESRLASHCRAALLRPLCSARSRCSRRRWPRPACMAWLRIRSVSALTKSAYGWHSARRSAPSAATALRDGMTPVVVGAAAGLAGAYLLTGLLTRLLYHVSETDPGTFAAVPIALAAVALVACAIPARRAARIDPICRVVRRAAGSFKTAQVWLFCFCP